MAKHKRRYSIRLNSIEAQEVDVHMWGESKILFPFVYDEKGRRFYSKRGKAKTSYLIKPAFFDCETSWNHDEENPIGWVYQWCYVYHNLCICGRTPSEFIAMLKKIRKVYNLNDSFRQVIYIHNASYDLTYLMGWIHSEFESCRVLAMDSHKILTFECEGFIFKCSYLLSNRSLNAWGDFTKAPIRKAVGAIDYDLVRYQDEELSYNDWYYQVNDVYAMQASYNIQESLNDDTVATIPLTNTGYVRRDARIEAKLDPANRKAFQDCRLTVDTYRLARDEFRGALSGGNRFYRNKLLEFDVAHYDYKSDYPACQMLRYAPMSKFVCYYDAREDDKLMTMAELDRLCKNFCVLMKVVVKDMDVHEDVTCVYESVARVKRGQLGRLDIEEDNGRVLHMRGATVLSWNELDWKWIKRQYDIGQIAIEEVYISERGLLPDWLRNTIHKYFEIKETAPKGIQRDKSKNNLNSCYGMTATDIVRTEWDYNFDSMEFIPTREYDDDYLTEKLDEYYNGRNNVMWYQWACWCTAHARDQLLTCISEIIGYENFIYCDTDSSFFKDSPEIRARIEEYNKDIINQNIELCLHVTNAKGGISYYGTFEDESADEGKIVKFKYLHSKCYGFETEDGELHVTIAGVSRIGTHMEEGEGFTMRGSITNAEELEDLDNLANGFTFYDCGATNAMYVDHAPAIAHIDGHRIEYASSCIIRKTTKTMNSILNPLDLFSLLDFIDNEEEV